MLNPSYQILNIIEENTPNVKFNLQKHLLGGVSIKFQELSFLPLPLYRPFY